MNSRVLKVVHQNNSDVLTKHHNMYSLNMVRQNQTESEEAAWVEGTFEQDVNLRLWSCKKTYLKVQKKKERL